MKRSGPVLLCACSLIAVALLTGRAKAEHPAYLILRTPAVRSNHHVSRGYYPGNGYGVSTQTYAYGWFGAPPRRHWVRQFGYYRNYTQWGRR